MRDIPAMELAKHGAQLARDSQHRLDVEATTTQDTAERIQPAVFENESGSVAITNQIARARDSRHEQATQQSKLPFEGFAVRPVRRVVVEGTGGAGLETGRPPVNRHGVAGVPLRVDPPARE